MELFNYYRYTYYPFKENTPLVFSRAGYGDTEIPKSLISGLCSGTYADGLEKLALVGIRSDGTNILLRFALGSAQAVAYSQMDYTLQLEVANPDGYTPIAWNSDGMDTEYNGDNGGFPVPQLTYLHVIPEISGFEDVLRTLEALHADSGSYEWLEGFAEIDPTVHKHYTKHAVTSLSFYPAVQGGASGTLFTDLGALFTDMREIAVSTSVVFYAGYNVRASTDDESNTLKLIGESGAGMGRVCERPVEASDNRLQTLGGVRPDANGNLTIVGGPGVQVIPLPYEHKIVFRYDNRVEACP